MSELDDAWSTHMSVIHFKLTTTATPEQFGKGQLQKWFAKTLKAIEAWNYEISAAAKA